jgi:hypothetical protein
MQFVKYITTSDVFRERTYSVSLPAPSLESELRLDEQKQKIKCSINLFWFLVCFYQSILFCVHDQFTIFSFKFP